MTNTMKNAGGDAKMSVRSLSSKGLQCSDGSRHEKTTLKIRCLVLKVILKKQTEHEEVLMIYFMIQCTP